MARPSHPDWPLEIQSQTSAGRKAAITAMVGVSLILAILRAGGIKDEAFQALAHLWVGFLIGGYIWGYNFDRDNVAGCMAVFLTVVEVIFFLVLPR